jgi:hypothetical protein
MVYVQECAVRRGRQDIFLHQEPLLDAYQFLYR